MDISNIKAENVTIDGGFHFGDKNAPVKIVEFLNLRCPYSKQWWDKSKDVLDPFVEDGKVERIIKHFDKEKPSLRKGNVLHHQLSYEDLDKTRKDIDYIFDHFDEWGELEEEKITEWGQKHLDLEAVMNLEQSNKIIEEANEANVTLVPTVFIEDSIFDENIPNEELKKVVESKLDKETE